MNYEADLRIDESNLDLEWLEQPSLMMRYGMKSAEARQELDLAKENLNLVKAELDLAIRNNPESYGLNKVTEAALFAMIQQQDDYKTAYSRFVDATYQVNLLQVAIEAIQHRKSALENLVRLHGQQYFAGPKIPHDLAEVREAAQRRANEAVGKAMRRGR